MSEACLESWKLCWCDGMGDTNIGWEEGVFDVGFLFVIRKSRLFVTNGTLSTIYLLCVIRQPASPLISKLESSRRPLGSLSSTTRRIAVANFKVPDILSRKSRYPSYHGHGPIQRLHPITHLPTLNTLLPQHPPQLLHPPISTISTKSPQQQPLRLLQQCQQHRKLVHANLHADIRRQLAPRICSWASAARLLLQRRRARRVGQCACGP